MATQQNPFSQSPVLGPIFLNPGNFAPTSGPGYPTNPTQIGINPSGATQVFAPGGFQFQPGNTYGPGISGTILPQQTDTTILPTPSNENVPSSGLSFQPVDFAPGAYAPTPSGRGFASGLAINPNSGGIDLSTPQFTDVFGPVGSASGDGPGGNPIGTGSGVSFLNPPSGVSDATALGPIDPTLTQTATTDSLGGPLPGTSIGTDIFGNPLGDATGAGGMPGNLGTAAPASDWWTTFTALAANFFQRGAIVVLGVILLGAAAWAIAHGEAGMPHIARKFA